MKRLGTVLRFKPGVTRAEADKALVGLTDLLEPCWLAERFEGGGYDYEKTRYDAPYRLEEYDDKWGGPVWYIP